MAAVQEKTIDEQIAALTAQKKDAVAEEDFENAAIFKAKIAELEVDSPPPPPPPSGGCYHHHHHRLLRRPPRRSRIRRMRRSPR